MHVSKSDCRLALCRGLLIAAWLCGCNEPENRAEVVDQPFAGVEVRLAIPAQWNLPEHWRAAMAEWQTQTAADARLEETDMPDSGPAAFLASQNGPTLALIPATWVGELAAHGRVAPLPESAILGDEGVRWNDLFAGLREGFAGLSRRPAVIPVSMPVLVCYYRKDLLERSGLDAPQTWEDYQALLDRLPAWAPGLEAVEPLGPEFRATMFLARAVNYARHHTHYSVFFDYQTGEPMIDNPAFARALEELVRAQKAMPQRVLTLSPAECRQEVMAGRAALGIGFEPAGAAQPALAAHPRSVAARGEGVSLGICRLPGARQAYNPTRQRWEAPPNKSVQHITLVGFGGYCFCGIEGAPKVPLQAAWSLARALATDDFASGLPAGMAGLCRESQLLNPVGFVGDDLEGAEVSDCLAAMALALREPHTVAALPVPGRARFLNVLSDHLGRVLDGQAEPRVALEEVSDAWKALVEEIGPDRLCAGYRSVLGLPARPSRP